MIADPEHEPQVAIVRHEDVAAAHERHRGAGLQRFVALAAQRERNLALTVQLEAAVVELPLQQHVPEHRDELLVASARPDRAPPGP